MGVLDVFRPRWKHSDRDVRLAAARAADVNIARHISEHDPDPEVRSAAARRLQECLRQIALDFHEPVGRRAEAAAALTDVRALVDVAVASPEDVAVAAVSRIDDPLLLSEIDLRDRGSELPKAVVAAILRQLKTDHARAFFAMRSRGGDVGIRAVEMIADQTLLLDLARNAASSFVRIGAIRELTQPSDGELLSAAATQEIADVCYYALSRVSATALANAYVNADSPTQRERLAWAIVNPHPLAVPSQKESDGRVLSAVAMDESLALQTRGGALRRLPEPVRTDALKTILVTVTSDDARQLLVSWAVSGSSWCPKCRDIVRTFQNGYKDALCGTCETVLWFGPPQV